MLTFFKSKLRRFARDEHGNMSIEAMFFIPLMLTVLAATFTLHDGFRYKSLNVKAAYTISDALSRETDPITPAYLDGMLSTMEFLTRSEGPYSLRVSVIKYDETNDEYILDWSETRGEFVAMDNDMVSDIRSKLPNLLDNEWVIVVETQTDYAPPFVVEGFYTDELFYNFTFTRPRFAPKLVWADA